MIRFLIAFAAIIFPFSANAQKLVSVSANVASTIKLIPSNFVGLSIEVGDLINGYFQCPSTANTTWVNTVKFLGSNGVLRIGGASSDVNAPTPPALTQAIANNFATCVSSLGAGWTLIYGLDLNANNSAVAATQAGYIDTAFGSIQHIFQFCNECDSYLSSSVYGTRWNAYYTSVSAAVSGLIVDAVDIGNFQNTQTYVAQQSVGVSGLREYTQHWYATSNGQMVNAAQMIASPQNQATFNNFIYNYNWAGSTPFRLAETNNIASGGNTGLSDRFMSAAFALNQAITFFKSSAVGINWHNAYNGSAALSAYYNPVIQLNDGNFGAGSEFYGLFLFSKIEGQNMIPLSIGGNGNVTGIATKGTNGNANIIVVNNDQNTSVIVTPNQTSAWTTANVLQISTSDKNGCTSLNPIVGGAPINEGGSWSGAAVSLSAGNPVNLGPCEAALIQIQP